MNEKNSIEILAGGIAHDINNILGVLITYPSLILAKLPKDSAPYKYVEKMSRSVEELSKLSQNLAQVYRENSCILTTVDMDEMIQQLKSNWDDYVQIDLNAKNAKFLGNFERVSTLIDNFIKNLEDGIQPSERLKITSQVLNVEKTETPYAIIPKKEYIVLEIHSCAFIEEEHLPRVFEPFYIKKVLRRYRDGFAHALLAISIRNIAGYLNALNRDKETIYQIYLPLSGRK
ncbi:hypothetical protein [Candidatus Uabimicrobium amorphum]|uniref:Two-component sensor histidine kinase n=1 Tax=Uabimicrobium amorphum TaxID=2596890 RepID=A0A5S9IN85_UABAM|nr:hypothetical protein [Candidatus Uabimicrobium amorphum]BBM84979.1 two-component sensor histidine kinase [Candidatus Uabimicrobium amorphum]